MHDLHSVEAKIDMSNTEGIMYVVAHPTTTPLDKDNRIYTMRNALPYWAKGGAIKTPDGKTGTAIAPDEADKNTEIDNDTKYGRKKRKTICAVLSTTIAGDGWKICVTTTLD